MKIIQVPLTSEIKSIIYDGFEQHAIERVGASEISDPICFYIEGENNNIASAVVCQIFWGAMHIKYVWTDLLHRKKGYATVLIKKAVTFAKANKCSFCFVETMSFQAPEFYKKFGFEVEFKRDGYSHNTSLYYMKKTF